MAVPYCLKWSKISNVTKWYEMISVLFLYIDIWREWREDAAISEKTQWSSQTWTEVKAAVDRHKKMCKCANVVYQLIMHAETCLRARIFQSLGLGILFNNFKAFSLLYPWLLCRLTCLLGSRLWDTFLVSLSDSLSIPCPLFMPLPVKYVWTITMSHRHLLLLQDKHLQVYCFNLYVGQVYFSSFSNL